MRWTFYDSERLCRNDRKNVRMMVNLTAAQHGLEKAIERFKDLSRQICGPLRNRCGAGQTNLITADTSDAIERAKNVGARAESAQDLGLYLRENVTLEH